MYKFIKESYLFIILFLILILKNPILNLININLDSCNTNKYTLLEQKYNDLLKFNDIDYEYNTNFLNTIILNKNIYDYREEIIILGGTDKKLTNNIIVYNNTLIGVITKNDKKTSTVRLLKNKNSRVSVIINDEMGVLQFNGNNLVVKNISNYSNINIGDKIYTTGIGNINEKIFVGTVKDIVINNKNLEKSIIVNYNINIKDINYVTVIMGQL